MRKLDDMLANRVEANLAATARTTLVDLPADRSVTADEFVALQAKLVRSQGDRLAIRCVLQVVTGLVWVRGLPLLARCKACANKLSHSCDDTCAVQSLRAGQLCSCLERR